MDDHELLRNYVHSRRQDAFRELVERHLGMVYSVSRRIVGDAHLAEEVAQSVFVTLAQKAASIEPPLIVAGWLYNTSRHLAMHAVRTEQRRRLREVKAAAMQASDSGPGTDQILDELESAMTKLEGPDRDALVLRYLEDRSLRDVGAELGISEDAARMRVNRAVDRLRSVFETNGLRVTTALVVSALAASTTGAVPSGLSAAITAAAVAGAATTATTYVAVSTMNWINAKFIAATLAAAVLTGTGTYFVQQQRMDHFREGNARLTATIRPPAEDATEELRLQARAQAEELERLRSNASELLQLRNEVSQLRRQLTEQQETSLRTPAPPSQRPAQVPAPGAYLPRERLAHLGYATPEAGIQTLAWAIMTGTESEVAEGLSPELIADTVARQTFERNRNQMASLFRGMQLVAMKTIGENQMEFKTRYDLTQGPGSTEIMELYVIAPMVRTEKGWKLGATTRDYNPGWEQSGEVQILAP